MTVSEGEGNEYDDSIWTWNIINLTLGMALGRGYVDKDNRLIYLARLIIWEGIWTTINIFIKHNKLGREGIWTYY